MGSDPCEKANGIQKNIIILLGKVARCDFKTSSHNINQKYNCSSFNIIKSMQIHLKIVLEQSIRMSHKSFQSKCMHYNSYGPGLVRDSPILGQCWTSEVESENTLCSSFDTLFFVSRH